MANSINLFNGKTIELSDNAYETLRAVGNPEEIANEDLRLLQGGHTPEDVLRTCLNGADGVDIEAGWSEYVGALAETFPEGAFELAADLA